MFNLTDYYVAMRNRFVGSRVVLVSEKLRGITAHLLKAYCIIAGLYSHAAMPEFGPLQCPVRAVCSLRCHFGHPILIKTAWFGADAYYAIGL
jgi:hypothetical protein